MVDNSGCQAERLLYRLEVDAELTVERAEWLEATLLEVRDGHTVMLISATDQAELHALLRRVRDVNLRIVELRQLDANGETAEVAHE